ncbi:MAG TPA: hypothetical protein DCO68_13025 [Methylophilaceae bacterium]|nr:hypothetical protein [Methylophilaceae bacterium]HAJ72991.1 hypothetical protein [Methylophilaceae bacterium]
MRLLIILLSLHSTLKKRQSQQVRQLKYIFLQHHETPFLLLNMNQFLLSGYNCSDNQIATKKSNVLRAIFYLIDEYSQTSLEAST